METTFAIKIHFFCFLTHALHIMWLPYKYHVSFFRSIFSPIVANLDLLKINIILLLLLVSQ